MLQKFKVSVVIPIYNRSQIIKRTIDSVLIQTHQNFEIIVIDDGSNDIKELEDILSSYNDTRIILIKHTQNKNGATARNTGIKIAKGEFIAFLDSDDEWNPLKLEKQLQLILSHNNNRTVVYCQSKIYYHPNDNNEVLPILNIKERERVGDYLFINKGLIPTPSILLSNELAKSVLFNESLRRHQDYDFLLRLESIGAKFSMAKYCGVRINWNEKELINDKGGTVDFSMEWVQLYSKYLSRNAKAHFLLNHVIFRLIDQKNKRDALIVFKKNTIYKFLNFRKLILVVWYFVFGKSFKFRK